MSKLTILLFLTAAGCWGQTPSLIHITDNSDWNVALAGGTGVTLTHQLIPSLSGNALVLYLSVDEVTGCQAASQSSCPTITDNQSNTWPSTPSLTCDDTGNQEVILFYVLPNAAAGTTKITIAYHANSTYGSAAWVAEFNNVATSSPVDKTSCNITNSSTSITAGSSGTLTSGDLVIQGAWNDTIATINTGGALGVHYTKGSQSNITWNMLVNSSSWATGAQYGVYGTTTSFTPTFTESTSGGVSAAIYLKAASAGTALGSGAQILSIKNVPTNFFGTSQTVYTAIPAAATTIVANWAAGPHDLTTITDSHSNTWSSNHAYFCDSLTSTCVHNHRADGATASPDMNIAFTWASTPGTDDVLIYGISGLANPSLNTTSDVFTANGSQSTAGNLTYFSSISPSYSPGIALFDGSDADNTAASFTSPSGANFDGCYQSNEPLDTGGCAANNPWGNYPFSATSAQTWTVTYTSGTQAVNAWAAEVDMYQTAQTASLHNRTQLGVGQ